MPVSHVLHVVDRVTGGVPIAVRTYIQNSPPHIIHSVLTPFIDGGPADIWAGTKCELLDLGNGHLKRLSRIRRTITNLNPLAIHAHSSFAGAYTRLVARAHRQQRIIYSPHCFAFERKDLSPLLRTIYLCLERLMMSNTSLIAACSAQEARIANLLTPKAHNRVTHVPNVAAVQPGVADLWSEAALRIGMIGRISPQKDPAMFIELAALLRVRDVQAEMVWLGSGNSDDMRPLQEADIQITGWLPEENLRRKLLGLHVYFHCAAWEGFPIAVLDAHAAGLPILVRNISAFADVPIHLTFEEGLEDFLRSTSEYSSFARWAKRNHTDWSDFLATNTTQKQTESLRQVWTGANE